MVDNWLVPPVLMLSEVHGAPLLSLAVSWLIVGPTLLEADESPWFDLESLSNG